MEKGLSSGTDIQSAIVFISLLWERGKNFGLC